MITIVTIAMAIFFEFIISVEGCIFGVLVIIISRLFLGHIYCTLASKPPVQLMSNVVRFTDHTLVGRKTTTRMEKKSKKTICAKGLESRKTPSKVVSVTSPKLEKDVNFDV